MSKVSWYKQRLKALLFKARFADKVEEIKPVRSKARYSPIGLALLLCNTRYCAHVNVWLLLCTVGIFLCGASGKVGFLGWLVNGIRHLDRAGSNKP